MSLELMFVYCPACARESLAETPPCPEGHGDLCPDLACVECGTALSDATVPDPSFFSTALALHRPRRAA